jgi:Erv1 / Alr family
MNRYSFLDEEEEVLQNDRDEEQEEISSEENDREELDEVVVSKGVQQEFLDAAHDAEHEAEHEAERETEREVKHEVGREAPLQEVSQAWVPSEQVNRVEETKLMEQTVREKGKDMREKVVVTPDIWGRPFWVMNYTLVMTLFTKPQDRTPEELTNALIQHFMVVLPTLMPCIICRTDWYGYIQKYPLTEKIASDPFEALIWVSLAHRHVRDKLGKPRLPLITTPEMAIRFVISPPNQTDVMNVKTGSSGVGDVKKDESRSRTELRQIWGYFSKNWVDILLNLGVYFVIGTLFFISIRTGLFIIVSLFSIVFCFIKQATRSPTLDPLPIPVSSAAASAAIDAATTAAAAAASTATFTATSVATSTVATAV